MRYVLAALIVVVASSAALAMPWQQHPTLSFAGTPMAESPDQGLMGHRTTRGFFGRLDRAGYRCDAQDRPARHIHIVCLGPDRNRFDYDGQFVGAGYLQLNRIKVDGVPLSRDGIVAHQDRVYEDQPPSLEGE